MTERRGVRVDPAFLDDLDNQLDADRGPNGEPPSTDFIVIELPAIVDDFARRFDELPLAYAGLSDYWVLVASGILVAG